MTELAGYWGQGLPVSWQIEVATRFHLRYRPSNMPPTYKYVFLPVRREKALKIATSTFYSVYNELKDSKGIAPEIVERLHVVRLLLSVADSAMWPDAEAKKLLEKVVAPKERISDVWKNDDN